MPIIQYHAPLRRLLHESKTVAVIGISPDPARPSHFVSEVVKSCGFEMHLINPRYAGREILGEKVLASIRKAPGKIDIVNVFRRPEDVPAAAREAEEKGFTTFWLQPGTENQEVITELDRAGYNVVFGLCIKTCCQILL